MKPRPCVAAKTRGGFDLQSYLESTAAPTTANYSAGEVVFSQGDSSGDVKYLQTGVIKLSVLSRVGKGAVVAMLAPGNFFGEGALAGQSARVETATAMAASRVLSIEKEAMVRLLHEEPTFSDRFITYVLARNIRIEADLVDQLFNPSEQRLARTLLLLAQSGDGNPQRTLPRVSQETLAEMIGATRSRVNFFMNKFKKLGLVEYNRDLKINSTLLSSVLRD